MRDAGSVLACHSTTHRLRDSVCPKKLTADGPRIFSVKCFPFLVFYIQWEPFPREPTHSRDRHGSRSEETPCDLRSPYPF